MPCTQRVGILLYSACARLSFGLTLLRCFSAASNFSRAPTRSPPLRSATASFISDSASLHDATTSAQMTYVCAAYMCGGGECQRIYLWRGGVLQCFTISCCAHSSSEQGCALSRKCFAKTHFCWSSHWVTRHLPSRSERHACAELSVIIRYS